MAKVKETAEHFGIWNQAIVKESKSLKRDVETFYKGFNATTLWKRIFRHKRLKYPHICRAAEVVICLGVNNSSVERVFSQLSSMLSDRRLSLNAETMNDFLLLKANHRVWSEEQIKLILAEALNDFFMRKRRKGS